MKKLSLSILILRELHTATERILEAIETGVEADDYMKKLLKKLHKKKKDLADYIAATMSSEFTKLLSDQDEVRDNLYTGFRDYCISFCNNYDPEKVEAANYLNNIFHERGFSMQKLGYSAQTSSFIILFNDLKKKKAWEAITLLNGVDWFNKLVEEQNKFEDIYKQKIDTESTKTAPEIRSVKKGIARYLNALLNYIDLNAELNPDKFGTLENRLDDIISDIVTVAKARQTRKENSVETNKEVQV